MNFRLTALSFLVAATCGLSLNQAAHAEDGEERHVPSMRFDFAPNTYRMDNIQPRHHYSDPVSSVQSGAAPRNLLGIPSFVAKAAPMPVAAPAVAQTQVSTKIMSNSPFASLFAHPSTPLIAQGATPLAPIPWSPAKLAHIPTSIHTHTSAALRPTSKSHHIPTAVAHAKVGAPIASYGGKFFSQGGVIPGYNSDGSTVVDASVKASIMNKKH